MSEGLLAAVWLCLLAPLQWLEPLCLLIWLLACSSALACPLPSLAMSGVYSWTLALHVKLGPSGW